MAEPATLQLIATALTAGAAVHQVTSGKGQPKVADAGDPDSISKNRQAKRDAARRRSSGRASTVLSDTLG